MSDTDFLEMTFAFAKVSNHEEVIEQIGQNYTGDKAQEVWPAVKQWLVSALEKDDSKVTLQIPNDMSAVAMTRHTEAMKEIQKCYSARSHQPLFRFACALGHLMDSDQKADGGNLYHLPMRTTFNGEDMDEAG